MLRTPLLALAPLAAAAWVQPADACTCPPRGQITHPSGPTISARDGFAGEAMSSRVAFSVTYADDPTNAPIPGQFRVYGQEFSKVWTFVPAAPLTVGRTVRAALETGPERVRTQEFVVDNSTVAPPAFAGVTGMQAILSHFVTRPANNCAIGPLQSRVVVEGVPSPSASAPVIRYFFYRQGTPPPAQANVYGVAFGFDGTVYCGWERAPCAPDLPFDLQVGETWCVRVEATDLRGHRSGYDAEACATVVGEDVRVDDHGGILVCHPVVDDGGTPADAGDPVADAGDPLADAGGPVADAGDSPAAAAPELELIEKDDGCACVRPRDGGARVGLIGVLALGGALLGRRRRRSSGTPPTGEPRDARPRPSQRSAISNVECRYSSSGPYSTSVRRSPASVATMRTTGTGP